MDETVRKAQAKIVYVDDKEVEASVDVHTAMQIADELLKGQPSNQQRKIKEIKISMNSQSS